MDNASKPYVWLKIEAIGTFEDPENIKVLTPKLFEFFTNELKIEQVTFPESLPILSYLFFHFD